MSRGAGRVERTLLAWVNTPGLLKATTEELCRAVFETTQVTKSQRVSLLRVMRRFPDGSTLPGPAMLSIFRTRNKRSWLFFGPATTSPSKRTRKTSTDRKLASALRLLASNHSGERDAALLAAQRLLSAKGLDWNDVAAIVEREMGGTE